MGQHAHAPLGMTSRGAPVAISVPVGTALLLGSAAFAMILQRYPPSWLVVAAATLGGLSTLALVLAKYELAVTLGILLLGVVKFEPSPPDAILGVAIAVAAVTGRFKLVRCPLMMVAISAVFLALNVLSAIEAVDPVIAARYFAITLYLVVLAVFLTSFVDSEHRARLVVTAYLVSALVSSVLGTVAIVSGFGYDLLTLNDRAQGLFQDPNVFGPFLTPVVLILIAEVINPRLLRLSRRTMAICVGVLLVGVLFSYSRGAYVNLAAGLLVMFGVTVARRGGSRQAMGLVVALILAGVALIGVVSVTGSLDFLEQRAQRQAYDSERFHAQRQGIIYGETKPIGIGPGQFEVLQRVVSHNTYVRALAEQGFLGLLAWLGLIIGTLFLGARNAILGRDTFGIGSAPLLGAWVGLGLSSFFVDTLHWRHLWVVAALVWVGAKRDASDG